MKTLRSKVKVALAVVSLSLSMVVVAPLPAMAACDEDHLDFGSGSHQKFSLDSGFASSGTCSDVNMRYYQDGDGCNSEAIEHKGWYYDAGFDEWIPGSLGFEWSNECHTYADNPLLTSVNTGTEYDFESHQNGGYAKGMD